MARWMMAATVITFGALGALAPPASAAADPTPTPNNDQLFISTARSEGSPDRATYATVPDNSLIGSAHAVCDALDGGKTIPDEVAAYQTVPGHSQAGGAYFVGLAAGLYCPIHISQGQGGYINPSPPCTHANGCDNGRSDGVDPNGNPVVPPPGQDY
jgi:hypothetical protein